MMNKRAALIIASFEYHDPGFRALQAPGNDAEALDRVLADPLIGDFNTKILSNEPRHVVMEAIEEFFSDCSSDDLLLLYFAGHGIKDTTGRLYLAATDTKLQRLVATGISATDINYLVDQSYSARKVLLLDCCYSGAFARGLAPRSSEPVGVKQQFQGHGLAVITASDSFEYAFEDGRLSTSKGEPSSVFTNVIVKGLESGKADLDGDGQISIQDLYTYIVDEVRRITPRQTPTMSAARIKGGLYIARNRHRLAELPTPLRDALNSDVSWQREGAVGGLKDLLSSEDAGLKFAALGELRRLTQDDSRRVSGAAIAALAQEGQAPEFQPATPTSENHIQLPRQASIETAVSSSHDGAELVLNHRGGIQAIAFSPTGSTLATGGPDKSVRIWDLSSGHEIQHLLQQGAVEDIAFSPDGAHLAVASGGMEVSIWDVASGRQLHTFSSMQAHSVAFSPDGTQLAYPVVNGGRIVSTSSGGKIRRLKARMSYAAREWEFYSLALSKDGSELAIGGSYKPIVGSEHGMARVWNTTSGEEILTLVHDTPGSVIDVAFDPDGTWLATASVDHTAAMLWACDSGKIIRQFAHDDFVTAVSFSPDGTKLATGSKDRSARLWDVSSGQELRRFQHDWQITDVAISPDGRRLAAGNGRNSARVWSIR